MGYIGERTIQGMSVVIGIAGDNFCSFVADGRRVLNTPTDNDPFAYSIESDTYQKIFRANSRVLIGGTGFFYSTESILAPMTLIDRPDRASVKVTVQAVKNYLKQHKNQIISPRNYMVGGKKNDGGFCLYKISFDPTIKKITTEEWNPSNKQYAIAIALPQSLIGQEQHYIDQVYESIQNRNHDRLIRDATSLIKEIADIDDTVGKNVLDLTIT